MPVETPGNAQNRQGGNLELLRFLQEKGDRGRGWRAVYVRVSALKADGRKGRLSAMILRLLDAGAGGAGKGVILKNDDVVSVLSDPGGKLSAGLTQAVMGVVTVPVGADFCRSFDLETELAVFMAAVTGVEPTPPAEDDDFDIGWHDEDAKQPAPEPEPAPPSASGYAGPPKAKLVQRPELKQEAFRRFTLKDVQTSPKQIAMVEQMFARANLDNFIRNQTAYSGSPETGFKEAFDEMYISIDYLSAHLKDRFKITADRWLFQYLTQTLDERLLKIMGPGQQGEQKRIRYSVNLNVSTVISDQFLTYDAALPLRARRNQVIEFQGFDILAHAADFRFVRTFLNARGYLVCVDGVDADLIRMIDWVGLGVDMIKVAWKPAYLQTGRDLLGPELWGIAERGGADLVLCRCDDEEAIRWGLRHGVGLFQGWYLDGLRDAKHLGPRPRAKA